MSVRFRDTWRVNLTSSDYVIVLEDSRPEESKQSDLHDLYVFHMIFYLNVFWNELKRVVVVFCCVMNGCEWLVWFTLQTILEHTALTVQANNILRKICAFVLQIYMISKTYSG